MDKIQLDQDSIKCLIIEDFNPYTTFIGLTNSGLNEIQYITICNVLNSGIDIILHKEQKNFIMDKMDKDSFEMLSSYDQKKITMAEEMIERWASMISHNQLQGFTLNEF